jgi:hypothetical protein
LPCFSIERFDQVRNICHHKADSECEQFYKLTTPYDDALPSKDSDNMTLTSSNVPTGDEGELEICIATPELLAVYENFSLQELTAGKRSLTTINIE